MATSNYTPVLAQLEAQRFQAQQAARELVNWNSRAWEAALERSAELFTAGRWADARRVMELAKEAHNV